MLEDTIQTIVDWADELGLVGLAIVSATEAAFQPAPPDLLVMPMALAADDSARLLAIFLVVTLSSVLGSLGGYAIGLYGGRPIIQRFADPSTSRKLDQLISKYGDAGVFIAALSPIPYKLLAWTAGAARMDIKTFVLAGLLGRGIRFGLEVLVLGVWGEEFISLLEDPLFWLVSGIVSIVAFIPLNKWWRGLDGTDAKASQQN